MRKSFRKARPFAQIFKDRIDLKQKSPLQGAFVPGAGLEPARFPTGV